MYKLCSDLYIVFYSVQGKLDLIWVINSVMIISVPLQVYYSPLLLFFRLVCVG